LQGQHETISSNAATRTPEAEAPPSARTADEICRNIRLGPRSRKLLAPGLKPGQYLSLLVENRLHADAVRYMAHALLNREAVWWACLCTRSTVGENLSTMPEAQRQGLGAAVRWVLEPTEAHRQGAARWVEPAGVRTPAGALAKAASFALGQSEPVPLGSNPPNALLTARLAAASVLLSGTTADQLRRFIVLGLDVAYGQNRWN